MVFAGCVGDDELANELRAVLAKDGLGQVYQTKKGERTGACGVIITDHNRYASVTALDLRVINATVDHL